jgi:hypothetical protein
MRRTLSRHSTKIRTASFRGTRFVRLAEIVVLEDPARMAAADVALAARVAALAGPAGLQENASKLRSPVRNRTAAVPAAGVSPRVS